MALSITKRVPEMLQKHAGEKKTAREIAEWIFKTYPAECEEKRKASTAKANPLDTDLALIQQIVAEIGAKRNAIERKNPNIRTTEERPRHYYYATQSVEDEANSTTFLQVSIKSESKDQSEARLNEHDLYPILATYLKADLDVHSLRIDEKRSKNSRGKGGNKWLFPDLVGLEDLGARWHREIKESTKERADTRTKLWSFEVKLVVNTANVREVYFQAVSNSTWANVGYLVAREFSGSDTLRELRVLAGLHGIGVIRLNSDAPSESEILIPSVVRNDVDWDTANRIAEENDDFVDYIKLVKQFHQTGEIRDRDWQ
jgi:hypothetical protein